MRFLTRLAELRAINTRATKKNEEILEQATEAHEAAVAMDRRVTEQTRTLTGTDRRNHYSESLTHAFRGKTA